MKTILCDGIHNARLVNGVFRFDFYTAVENGKPDNTEVVIAVPVQALPAIISLFEQLRDRLLKEGVLSRKEPVVVSDRSPNF